MKHASPLLLLAALVSGGCGQDAASSMAGREVAVTVTPGDVIVRPGATVTFEAMERRLDQPSTAGVPADVVWSVAGQEDCGAVTQDGTYTAPRRATTCVVIAARRDDPADRGAATVTVEGDVPTVLISPTSASLKTGEWAQFSASAAATATPDVDWSVEDGSGCGVVTQTGLYTAPSTPSTCRVVVSSRVNSAVRATAVVSIVLAAASIAVTPEAVTLDALASTTFTASIAGLADQGVTWSVREGSGCGSITPEGVYTAPGEPGTCHVVASSRAQPALTQVGEVTIAAAAPAQVGRNLAGINISAPLDWEKAQIYADIIRQSRDLTDATGANPVPVDADGWPVAQNFRIGLWGDVAQMHGTYALSFTGQATRVTGGAHATVSGLTYDPVTNVSTANLQVTTAGSSIAQVRFEGARRTPGGADGATQIRLMRPVAPGSSTTYPRSALFHAPLKSIVQRFDVVRFMDFTATNQNQQRTWSDRPRPTFISFGWDYSPQGYGWQGKGGPWEHAVRFANETHRDAWINIPAKVDDDYVRKVAQVFKCGSDGTLPWVDAAGACKPGVPPHAPLAPGLRLYVEYGNELWNTAGLFRDAWLFNRDAGIAEVNAGGSLLDFDGNGLPTAGARRLAKRGVEISRIFREVFGDAEMPYTGSARVRPILATQLNDGNGFITEPMRLLQSYYNNGGGDFVESPRPPSYYFYGAGGAPYYEPDPASTTLDLTNIWNSHQFAPGVLEQWARKDATRAATLGLKLIAYEGGPQLAGSNSLATKQAAVNDPRMTTEMIEHHREWSAAGGDLLVYLTAVASHVWGFTGNVNESNTAKLQAVDQIRTAPQYPIAFGALAPATLDANAFSVSCRGWDRPGTGSRTFTAGNTNSTFVWASYLFREEAGAARNVTVSGLSGSGTVGVYVDGVLVGTGPATGGSLTFAAGVLPRGLHGVIVRAVAGSFTATSIAVR